MKLITPELEQRFLEIGDQSESKDPLFIAKFFNPCGSETWYASEYDKETNICYGYVTGMFEDEWGRFSISELEALKLPFGLGVERDIHFEEQTYKQAILKTAHQRIKTLEKEPSQEQEQEQDIER